MDEISETAAEKTLLTIDSPAAGEIVTTRYYTFQISAPLAARVAVSVDNGDWRSCRFLVGYWWHDWADYRTGAHQLRVQCSDSDGAIQEVASRRVDVRLEPEEEESRADVRDGRRNRRDL